MIILCILLLLFPKRTHEKFKNIQRDFPAVIVQKAIASNMSVPEILGYIDFMWTIENHTDRQIKTLKLANQVSNHNKEFIGLLLGENFIMTPDRLSPPNKGGSRDHGFCQINDYWHRDKVNDSRFKDEQWQMETCYRLWKGGTKFYARPQIEKLKLKAL